MTFSIVGQDTVTGELGVAISTRTVAVGAMCIRARAGVGAVATQAWTNPLLSVDALDALESSPVAAEAMQQALAADPNPELRQVLVVSAGGTVAAHTGAETDGWSGQSLGAHYAAAGNMLVSEATLRAMCEAFETSADLGLAERLLVALEAGQGAGGDKRGRQSAALLVVRNDPYPWYDLRVDEHPDPVAELRRLFTADQEQLRPFMDALPTRDNPAGGFTQELREAMLTQTRVR